MINNVDNFVKETLIISIMCKYNFNFPHCGNFKVDFPLCGKNGFKNFGKTINNVQGEYRAVIALKWCTTESRIQLI